MEQRGHRRTGSSSSSSSATKRSFNFLVCCFNWGPSMKGRKRRRSSNGGTESGSTKGSPMFKKGGEIDEPSSPKVTCIGLVRVKTKRINKNQVMKKMRSKSKRTSFRRIEDGQQQDNRVVVLHHQDSSLPHRHHRWIHLPFAICEALKGMSTQLMKCLCVQPNCGVKNNRKNWCSCSCSCSCSGNGYCVFMRWLFTLEESNSGVNNVVEENHHHVHDHQSNKREMGIETPSLFSSTSSTVSDVQFYKRRSIDESKEEMAVDDDDDEDGEVVEEPRLSMCSVPPRNALLLMRSRSEPGRRSTLATRFLDDCVLNNKLGIGVQPDELVAKAELVLVEENRGKAETEQSEAEEVKIKVNGSSSPETLLEEDNDNADIEVVEEDEACENIENPLMGDHEEAIATLEEEERVERETSMEDKSETQQEEQEQSEIGEEAEQEHCKDVTVNDDQGAVNGGEEDGQDQDGGEPRRASNEIERTTEMLSDCLMMMMREPKVSMELSKETWVCSTDFIRHHQNHHQIKQVNAINGGDALIKSKPSNMIRKQKPITQAPPQPSPPLKPALREKKPKPEPLELTRCKSEPLRSSAKLASEGCFWKDIKLIVEPHRRSTVGAAGVGF